METKKHNPLGIASFIIGLFSGLFALFFIIMQMALGAVNMVSDNGNNWFYIIAGLLDIVTALAFILGIYSLFQKERKRVIGIMAVVMSAGMLYLNLGMLFVYYTSNS